MTPTKCRRGRIQAKPIEVRDSWTARFITKFVIDQHTKCWNWIGTTTNGGYARFFHGRRGQYQAHRYSYAVFVGELDSSLVIDHLCRNRVCVNPAHLEQVSAGENTLRGDTFAGKKSRQTHCVNGHEFTKDNIYKHRSTGGRKCRECHLIAARARYYRNKAKRNFALGEE